nr:PREDICTED: glutamyl aminopeptidase-like [Linepithema humile]XP_012217532.1 PREDICTED: glutamyl aminopeptidase-like [Linepithema humile]
MGNKVGNRPKGGAYYFDAVDTASTTSKSPHYNNTTIAFLCFLCGACFILSLVCSFLVTLIVLLNKTVVAASYQNAMDTTSFRLPKEVYPIHYNLLLHPDLNEGTFSGKVVILFSVEDTRKFIALHQKDLEITSADITTHGLKEDYKINISSISKPTEYEIFTISTEKDLMPGMYDLTLNFTGNLKKKIVGFYSSTYFNKFLNKTRYIATTKFEPTYARQAFPCFDEPHFKARFTVQLVHPTDGCYSALSNMNVEKIEPNITSGETMVTFAKTVPMSTYLACFIVSDFVADTKMAKGRPKGPTRERREFPVSIYSSKVHSKGKGYLAVETAVKAIEYYINLFDVDYPLPKLDMVAIPDFVSGAMENWGLVTYREARILYDDFSNSIFDKRDVINVICHEFAHMWFGNLVTLAWWNDLWLNEGFATFMSYKCANDIYPNNGYMDDFVVHNMHPVFITDSTLSSNPIVHEVKNPDEITALFNDITYKKGASVIRMMENFLPHPIFFGGISVYLHKYSYANAQTADLFNIFQEGIGKTLNITSIMDTWTRQEGYPVISVNKSEDNSTYILTQKRFLADPDSKSDPSKSNYGYKWTIPITYITNKVEYPTLVWFDKDASELVVEVDANTKWIKFNVDQVGYYRVNYSPQEWTNFTELLRSHHTRLSVLDRANLLNDAFSLAEAGELDYETVLLMCEYLTEEYHSAPWEVASSKLVSIYTLLNSRDTVSDSAYILQKFAARLVKTIYSDVTWTVNNTVEEENVPLSHIHRRVRPIILKFACQMQNYECLSQAKILLEEHLNERMVLHPDIRELVYHFGVYHESAQDENWNYLFNKLKFETDSSERNKLMTGLAGIKSTKMLAEYIEKAKDEKIIRTQDFLNCLITISRNPLGTSLVWDWVRNNWNFLVDRYTLNDRYLGQLIPSITSSFATQTKLEEMNSFFAKYPEAGAGKNYRVKALETVTKNIKWVAKYGKIFDQLAQKEFMQKMF